MVVSTSLVEINGDPLLPQTPFPLTVSVNKNEHNCAKVFLITKQEPQGGFILVPHPRPHSVGTGA